MRRFRNEALGDRPVIVVLGAPKMGNYVVLQPLLQGLRRKYPGARSPMWAAAAPRNWSGSIPGSMPACPWRIWVRRPCRPSSSGAGRCRPTVATGRWIW